MRRIRLVAILLLLIAAPAARADGPPAFPIAPNLARAPVGSWAEYQIRKGDVPPSTMRIALLARDKKVVRIELRGNAGFVLRSTAKQATTVFHLNVSGKLDPTPALIQIDGHPPMTVPAARTPAPLFTSPDRRTLVDRPTLKLAAGTFKTRHYESPAEEGETRDVWVADGVFPPGMVKMTISPATVLAVLHDPSNAAIDPEIQALAKDLGAVAVEPTKTPPAKPAKAPPPAAEPLDPELLADTETWVLVARGTGARMSVTATPRPYDAATLQAELRAAIGSGQRD